MYNKICDKFVSRGKIDYIKALVKKTKMNRMDFIVCSDP